MAALHKRGTGLRGVLATSEGSRLDDGPAGTAMRLRARALGPDYVVDGVLADVVPEAEVMEAALRYTQGGCRLEELGPGAFLGWCFQRETLEERSEEGLVVKHRVEVLVRDQLVLLDLAVVA